MLLSLETLETLLQIANEALTSIIVIVAGSILLYNLTRNLRSPVARASSALLATVTIVNMVDALTALEITRASLENWLRVQWIGIAFAPAAMFHLSDALLSTTGLISRGRRRRVTRRLYYLSALFLIMALFTDAVVWGMVEDPAPHLLSGPVFGLYVLYFLIATVVSVYNVMRARQRCLTTYTHRRMGYMLYSFTLPAFGIFPYTLLFAESTSSSLLFWLLVNVGNLGIVLMLLFMAYPLSFFNSNIPDRVIKTELMQFFLRGPFAGILVLLIILYLPEAGSILGVDAEAFTPFAAVAITMFWQWMVSLARPFLERYVVYPDDQSQLAMIQSVSQRLLTQSDLKQLLEALLAAICDLLRAPIAFIAVVEGGEARIEQVMGNWTPGESWPGSTELLDLFPVNGTTDSAISTWDSFWVVPLYSRRQAENNNGSDTASRLIGILAVQAPADNAGSPANLSPEEYHSFELLVQQTAQALDDRLLQTEVFAALEGLLPEIEAIQQLRDAGRYGEFPSLTVFGGSAQATINSPEFIDTVRDALRDYWGGPRLTQSPLQNLHIVQDVLPEHDNNTTRALRTVLQDAVQRLRPAGDRSMTRAEWTLYNIVDLRFIQGYKVRDVANRLAMSEADFYRKQRLAIEEVARTLVEMEQETPEDEI